jgi:integrase
MKQTMLSRIEAYLARRRKLGYKLYREGRQLVNFARYADDSGHRGPLTGELALRWASLPQAADPRYRAHRLDIVRVFARHQAVLEPATQVPARQLLGPSFRRKPPHIFTVRQVQLLLRRAARMSGQIRPLTWQTLYGLMACTGLRISEALALAVRDVDLQQGILTIRQSKGQHSRQVPLHPSALPRLRRYTQRRQQAFPQARHFFVLDRGQALSYSAVGRSFPSLTRDMIPSNGRPHVRPHDLRHTFACRVLLGWQRRRRGASGRVAILARYLGHTHLRDTYWYLTAVPELLEQAALHFTQPPQ